MKSFWELLKALPALLRLIEEIQKHADEAETKRKVAEDLDKIKEAFREKDANKLNDIFNSK